MIKDDTPSEYTPRNYHLWPVAIPWIIVLLLLVVALCIARQTSVTCHFSGELMSAAAQAAEKRAEQSKAGVTTSEEAPDSIAEKPKANIFQPRP